jgi:hypothetical protein
MAVCIMIVSPWTTATPGPLGRRASNSAVSAALGGDGVFTARPETSRFQRLSAPRARTKPPHENLFAVENAAGA